MPAQPFNPEVELNPLSLEPFFVISLRRFLSPADGGKEIAKLWSVGDIPLLFGVLDKFIKNDLILDGQSVRPGVVTEDLFLFF